MLVALKEILKDAHKEKYAVGAFNTPNLESVMAVVSAAEEENAPIILQHAEVHGNLIDLEVIAPIMLYFAKKATVPICVHLDHGSSFDLCIRAIRLGMTSIMYDASEKSFEQNILETRDMVKIAHSVNVSVEAELGHMPASSVGNTEGGLGTSSNNDCYTDPNLAERFVNETGVDALAISFGTVHGVYVEKPVLDLGRITEIKNKIDIPFVMHGGSGVSDSEVKTAIKNGITKINYYTYMSMSGGEGVINYIKNTGSNEPVFFHDISLEGVKAMKENARHAIKVFSCK